MLREAGYDQKVSPELGNVCFSCSHHQWLFTLASFAKIYADYHGAYTY